MKEWDGKKPKNVGKLEFEICGEMVEVPILALWFKQKLPAATDEDWQRWANEITPSDHAFLKSCNVRWA